MSSTPAYDYLIVGAGFSGLVFAERVISETGKTCLVVEKRNHIGGNSWDRYDEHGVLIHPYGPHYFRSNSKEVVDYLSRFTAWREVEYQVRSYTGGEYWKFPIHLDTFEQFIGRPSTSEEFESWLEANRVPIEDPRNSEEVILSKVGPLFYELFFKGYTIKQWKMHPRELDASVCGRIPVRTNRDGRYLRESFQALPKEGYHRLFENLVEACGSKLRIELNTDYRDVISRVRHGTMVYTGPIDAYFDYVYGNLPYRSLRFEHEHHDAEALLMREPISGQKGFYQPEMQVNFPNDHDYTRIVEIKHATGQNCSGSTIVKEYPEDYSEGMEPYYPVPNDASNAIYRRYKALADAEKDVIFVGRLATYKYLNMDQCVLLAMKAFKNARPEGAAASS